MIHAWRHWYGGDPWTSQPTCPLCRIDNPTQRMAGTDYRICPDCALDRPVELLLPEVTV